MPLKRAWPWDTRISTAAIWLSGMLHIESAQPRCCGNFGIEYAATAKWWRSLPLLRWKAPLPAKASPPARWAMPFADLQRLLGAVSELVDKRSGQRLKRTGWTRKEALGHLIDWAAAHQQVVRARSPEPKLAASGYPEDAWLSAQGYNDLPWHGVWWICAHRSIACSFT
jgi:hypothetical protein